MGSDHQCSERNTKFIYFSTSHVLQTSTRVILAGSRCFPTCHSSRIKNTRNQNILLCVIAASFAGISLQLTAFSIFKTSLNNLDIRPSGIMLDHSKFRSKVTVSRFE